MILFLNFAPLTFGGGVERWIIDVAKYLKTHEDVEIIEMDKKISDVYGKIVLKRPFDDRISKNLLKSLSINKITLKSFIPLTNEWRKINDKMKKSRKIYAKFEINELIILLYFGGVKSLSKVILGLHSPLIYSHENKTFFEHLHNLIYLSPIMGKFLKQFNAIHALTDDQKKLLEKKFLLKSIIKVPNYIFTDTSLKNKKTSTGLNIAFVGELTWRKGVDILAEVINKSSHEYNFYILGDGPGKDLIQKLSKKNIHYLGYRTNSEVIKVLEYSDVLLQPSRAESFSLAALEAMSQGVLVVSSPLSSPTMIKDKLILTKNNRSEEYTSLLTKIFLMKKNGELTQKSLELKNFIQKDFSKLNILSNLQSKVFN